MSTSTPTVFLVDDEAPVRRAVSRLLRAENFTVDAYASSEEFLQQADFKCPGCILLDMAMPGLSGLDLQRELAARDCHLPIIFLTGRADVPMTVKAMKRGAADFLTKPVEDAVLLTAIRNALEKDRIERKRRLETADLRACLATLTPREREVLDQIVLGRLNKQVAADLGAAEKTIKVHRARVMEKMQVASIAELARLIERLGPDGK